MTKDQNMTAKGPASIYYTPPELLAVIASITNTIPSKPIAAHFDAVLVNPPFGARTQ
jgi:hypothetical protein